MKVCDKTCIFCLFPIINTYLCMAKRSLLSERPLYLHEVVCVLKCNLHVTLVYAQELREKTKYFMKFTPYYCQYVRQPCVLK